MSLLLNPNVESLELSFFVADLVDQLAQPNAKAVCDAAVVPTLAIRSIP